MKNLELEYVGPGKWITADGAFGIIKKFRPINPMETSEVPSKMNKHLFSVRDLREMDMTGTFYELAPEIRQLRRFKDVHPFLMDLAKKEKFGLSESTKVVMDTAREQVPQDPSIVSNRVLFTDRVKGW